jgi:putative PIN family toxin of toxin-antitoxin system
VRIVLDTNVVISALLWQGTPHRLLETISHNERLQIFSSPALLEEFSDVLTRPAATKRLAMIGKTAREVIADYLQAIELVEPAETPAVVTRDPDDDHVLACAVAARAAIIVSGDLDLLELNTYRGIPIIRAAQALLRIEALSQ